MPLQCNLIAEDVQIMANKCSECMLCVSSCNSDCFEINGLDFYSLIGKLRKVQSSVGSAVLGCRANAKAPSHEKTFCFGFLSEEHIIALSIFANNHLQIDLSGCASFGRISFIVAVLEKRIADVEAKTSLMILTRYKLLKTKLASNSMMFPITGAVFSRRLKCYLYARQQDYSAMKTTAKSCGRIQQKKLPF